jgi:hypothetical protein
MMPYIYTQEATRANDIKWWTSHADDYDMYMNAGSAGELGRRRGLEQIGFWRKLLEHPAYDAFWRNQAVDKILAAQPLSRRAETATHAARLLRRWRFGPLIFGVGVVLAAHEFDLRDLGAIAAAITQPENPRVSAGPRLEAGRDRVKQLAHDLAILDIAEDESSRVQRPPVRLACGQAALGDGDNSLDERPELLGFRHGRFDVLELEERRCLVPQHGDAVLGNPPQLAVTDSVTHDADP